MTKPEPFCPRGLPEPLPPGERILWQGAPTVAGTAMRIFHARLVAAWFALAALVFGGLAASDGSYLSALGVALPTLAIGAGALALLALFSWLVHRTTVYTITDRRIVMRVGIALPITLNLPFAMIEGAGLHVFADGSGDIPVQLQAGERVAYLHLWPHARPWRVTQPEPMLRSVPEAETVAALLARTLAAYAGQADAAIPVIKARQRAADRQGALVAAGAR
ncbi:photosynthetic complex putative assembly protein PuhB [Methylobacterium brachythecii]|uniref:Photosynthetic complex assembly protein n=1 Tax=Methylobacterium brachythecii TaxID=1176177 RepID=A0A7W6F903_9HYPH|nr:photosynthetic complex putative assembly protein PuhB [Methylobacterium brachythecii]MBB3905047.1 hypothetical protein [Methylobacterium brachythecii]GLS44445.1 photosynthetic complex assembly protein [Methylobacterium brachythecii]